MKHTWPLSINKSILSYEDICNMYNQLLCVFIHAIMCNLGRFDYFSPPPPHRAYVCSVVSCEEVSPQGCELSISRNLFKIVQVKCKNLKLKI